MGGGAAVFQIEVRETHVAGDRWLWEWRVLSRWGIPLREGGGCTTEDEARQDGAAAAEWLRETRQRTTWRA